MPRRILLGSSFTSFHHPGRAQQVKRVNVAPEQVIITQKLICGAVHGENIIVHNTAAIQIPRIGFCIDILLSVIGLDELGYYECDAEKCREHQLEVCSPYVDVTDQVNATFH